MCLAVLLIWRVSEEVHVQLGCADSAATVILNMDTLAICAFGLNMARLLKAQRDLASML